MAITRHEIVPHIPIAYLTDEGTRIPSFQFSPPRTGDGQLHPPPRNEKYIPQYVNYQTHEYHDVSGPYTTDTHTSAEDKPPKDKN